MDAEDELRYRLTLETFYESAVRVSKRRREELVRELGLAVRASQTATATYDHMVAEHLGIDRTAHRCLDILAQEGPLTAGGLAERARLSPGAMTALLDRLEERGLARRVRDTADRRRVMVEPTPDLQRLGKQLYGSPADTARQLAEYTNEELELLIAFHRAGVAYQDERMRRLERLEARQARAAPSPASASAAVRGLDRRGAM